MAKVKDLFATLRAWIRVPVDLLIVRTLYLRARLGGYLRPSELYKPLGINDIRLLNIQKALTNRADEPVRVTLHHETLTHTEEYKTWKETAEPSLRLQKLTKAWFAYVVGNTPKGQKLPKRYVWGDYFALSYCWGTGGFTHSIILNGRIVAVTENLESALRSVRGEWGSLRLWVDALCINQRDTAERGREVLRMRNIYGKAALVYVHLGPQADDSHIALPMIERMSQLIREEYDLAKYMLEIALLVEQGKEVEDAPGIVAIYRLLCRPYWSRMWIIQELAMADESMLIGCGDHAIELSKIRQVLKFLVLNQQSFIAIVPNDLYTELTEAYASAIQMLWSYSRLRDLVLAEPDRDVTFAELCHPILRLIQYAKATEPRDKVYGILSLLPTKLAMQIDRGEKNYQLTTTEVFMNFTKSIIELTNELDVIWTSNYKQKSKSRIELPSWAPDWTLQSGHSAANSSTTEWYFGENEAYAAFDRAFKLPLNWKSGTSRADGGRHSSHRFSENGKILECEGFQLTSIWSRGPHLESISQDQNTPEEPSVASTVACPYTTKDDAAQAILRCLLLDGSGELAKNSMLLQLPWFGNDTDAYNGYGEVEDAKFSEMLANGWDPRSFGGGVSFFDVFRHHTSQYRLANRRFRDYFSDEVVPWNPDASLLDFNVAFANYMERRFIETTSRHIGLAPSTVEVGDKVYILIGSSMPVILRPLGEHYEVLGECFVDGFMKGEAMEALERGDFQLQKISLC